MSWDTTDLYLVVLGHGGPRRVVTIVETGKCLEKDEGVAKKCLIAVTQSLRVFFCVSSE